MACAPGSILKVRVLPSDRPSSPASDSPGPPAVTSVVPDPPWFPPFQL